MLCVYIKPQTQAPIATQRHHNIQPNVTQHKGLIFDTQHKWHLCIECRFAECRNYIYVMLSVIMLSVIMLSVIMLSVIMLSVIMLSVIILNTLMLSVVAPTRIH